MNIKPVTVLLFPTSLTVTAGRVDGQCSLVGCVVLVGCLVLISHAHARTHTLSPQFMQPVFRTIGTVFCLCTLGWENQEIVTL